MKPCDFLKIATWVKVNGWEYRENSVIPQKFSHDTEPALPEFAIVENIISSENQIFLVLKTLNTKHFNENFHSFEVELTTHCSNTSLDCIAECEPQWIVKNFDQNSNVSFVSPRHVV